jgi:hypothetical protein
MPKGTLENRCCVNTRALDTILPNSAWLLGYLVIETFGDQRAHRIRAATTRTQAWVSGRDRATSKAE